MIHRSAGMTEDTLPKLMMRNHETYGDRKIAMRNKEFGLWRSYSWKKSYESVKWFSLGLISMGFKSNSKISIIGDNEPQWYWAEFAAQSAGGAAIGIFVDASPEEVGYIVGHSDSVFVVVRDQEQVDKILSIREHIPKVEKVIYWDNKGMWSYEDAFLLNFESVVERGKKYEKQHPNLFEDNVKGTNGKDLAVICYTSGTTGRPKGAMVTHDNLISTVSSWLRGDPWHEDDNYVSFVSPAWIAEQLFGITASLICGATINFPEEPETATSDLREIGPSMLMYNTRLWESLTAQIQAKMNDGDFFKRIPYKLCFPIGYRKADCDFEKKSLSIFWQILWKIADFMVFRPLRDKIGLANTRSPYSGGAALSPDTFRFFRALGVNLRQIYGASEAGLISCQIGNDIKFETVGKPLPGFEVKISDKGEITVRGENVFPGYYKNDEETREKVRDGWYYTGDAGNIDQDGHIIFIDRMADLMELEDGTKYSPTYIEGRLKFSPYLRDCIVIGEGLISVLVQIDFDITGRWAEKNHIPFTTFSDLSRKPEVFQLIEKDVKRINEALPEAARVRKLVLLSKEFDPDEAELTRSRKIRRSFVTEKYGALLKAINEGKDEFLMESEVVYQDGRRGKTSTPVRIATVT